MRKDEVIGLVGKQKWSDFLTFLEGKTIGMVNGFPDYKTSDVWEYHKLVNKKPKKVKAKTNSKIKMEVNSDEIVFRD